MVKEKPLSRKLTVPVLETMTGELSRVYPRLTAEIGKLKRRVARNPDKPLQVFRTMTN
jgi:hypothetical protein